MHAIEPLLCGVRGAENGHAELYVRGTTTRATYYTDFEGSQAVSTGANLTLDDNGGVEAYVNVAVTVVVKDDDGVTVREFVAGSAAPNVEIRSLSITGTNYASGQADEGEPSTLQLWADMWLASAGAPDFKVDIDGTATNLSILGQLFAGLLFNVKQYGAVGDGSANDGVAIAAAITAAAVSGGVVYFPPGTYRITSALTWPANVNLVGAGAVFTTIAIDHASANGLEASGGNIGGPKDIFGLTIWPVQSNSGNHIQLDAASAQRIVVSMCRFGSSTLTTGKCIETATAGHIVTVERCQFFTGTGIALDSSTSTTIEVRMLACRFDIPATYGTNILQAGGLLLVEGCIFNLANHTTSSAFCVVNTNAAGCIVAVGNRFIMGSGTEQVFSWQSGATVNEHGNSFSADAATWNLYDPTSPAEIAAGSVLGSRANRELVVVSESAALTVDLLNYGHVTIVRQTNTAMTATVGWAPIGSEGWLSYITEAVASTGAILTIAAADISLKGDTGVTPTDINGRVSVFHLVRVNRGTGAGEEWWVSEPHIENAQV